MRVSTFLLALGGLLMAFGAVMFCYLTFFVPEPTGGGMGTVLGAAVSAEKLGIGPLVAGILVGLVGLSVRSFRAPTLPVRPA